MLTLLHYAYIYMKAWFQWEMAIHKYTGRVPLGDGHIIIIIIIIIYIYYNTRIYKHIS